MNPNNYQSNPAPDYSFITGQGGPELQPKKANTKVIIIFAGLVLLVVLTIILAVASKSSNSVKESVSQTQSVATSHLALVSEGKLDESKQLFSDPNKVKPEVYTYIWSTFMPSGYSLKGCKVTASDDSSATVWCPFKNDSSKGSILKYSIINGKIDSISNA